VAIPSGLGSKRAGNKRVTGGQDLQWFRAKASKPGDVVEVEIEGIGVLRNKTMASTR